MAARNSPVVALAGLAVLVGAAIGVHREGFAAVNASKQTTNQSDALLDMTASIVELLPLLVLALAAIYVVMAVVQQ